MIVQVKNCRLGFNKLAKAGSVGGSAAKFDATGICSDETTIVVTKEDGSKVKHPIGKMKAVIDAVLKAKFPSLSEPARKKIKNWCYNKADGSFGAREEYTNDDGDYWNGFDAETWYVSAAKREDKARGGIKCYDQAKNLISSDDPRLYSGCYVNLLIDVYAMDGDPAKKTSKTVQASLEGVQLVRSGEPLGMSGVDAADEFDEEEVEDDDAFNTGAADDSGLDDDGEIPF